MNYEPRYYLEIYPIVVKNNKPRSVHLIGDIFQLDKYRNLKVGREVFTHKQIGISEESIIKYYHLRNTLTNIVTWWGNDGVQLDLMSEEDANNFLKMKNDYEAIQDEWARIANAFLAWKRRRQIIMAWELEV